jgi:hypothetical protein
MRSPSIGTARSVMTSGAAKDVQAGRAHPERREAAVAADEPRDHHGGEHRPHEDDLHGMPMGQRLHHRVGEREAGNGEGDAGDAPERVVPASAHHVGPTRRATSRQVDPGAPPTPLAARTARAAASASASVRA